MSAVCMTFDLNWGVASDDDRRFVRIARNNLLVALALGLLIPWLQLPAPIKPDMQDPPRVATLIIEPEIKPPPPVPKPAQIEPPPEPVAEKPAAVKPVEKKPVAPAPEPVKPKVSAREKASKAGILAMSDALADLRDNTVANNFSKTSLSRAGGSATKTERAILTSGTTSTSGGIRTASMSRNTGGGDLAGRSTTAVHSPAGNAPATVGGKGKGDRTAGRSIEEIQVVFDRNKGSIYSVYNRALRSDPSLKGKLVLKLTIAANGNVTSCSVVSSELNDDDLAGKIVSRVKTFNFGAKDVNTITITYPIDFLPA